MSNRRKAGVKNRTVAYIAAGVVHLAIIGVMLFNFTSEKTETVEGFVAEKVDTINASVINESDIKDQQDKLKQQDRERERKKREKEKLERERLEKLKQESAQEEKEIEKLKEQQRKEREKAAELESERKAIALKREKEKQEAEDLKKKEEAERKKADAERKKKAEAEEKRKAKAALQKQAQDAEDAKRRERLEEALANEEAVRMRQEADQIAKQRSATLISKFFGGIQRKIEQKRNVDPRFETWRVSTVDIKLSPSGEVRSVRTIESSGSALYDQSVENAVYAASPFELPDPAQEPEAVKRLQNFELEVKHPSARR